MNFKAIVFDSNFLIKNYALTSHYLNKIVRTQKFYNLEIYIPEVVFDECIGNFDDSLKAAKETLYKTQKHFDNLGLNGIINKTSAAKKLDSSHKEYPKRLRKFIKDNNIKIIPYPSVKHKKIVEAMNQRKKPFTDNNVREKGYKDYLIIQSIKEAMIEKEDYDVLFLTENLGDFVCGEEIANKRKDELLSLDPQYDTSNVYVARSPATLFKELGSSIKKTCAEDVIEIFNKNLVKHTKDAIIEKSSGICYDLFSSFIHIDIFEDNINCEVIQSIVNIDEDMDMLEAKGIIKISFPCSFTVDNFDIQIQFIDNKFFFIEQVKDRIYNNRLSVRGEWTENFVEEKFSAEFIFEFIQFDYIRSPENNDIYLEIERL